MWPSAFYFWIFQVPGCSRYIWYSRTLDPSPERYLKRYLSWCKVIILLSGTGILVSVQDSWFSTFYHSTRLFLVCRMFGGSISRYFGKLHSLEGRCGAYFLPWFDSPLLEQCNCMQGSHWTSSTSVNVEWTCCCLSVFVGFTPLADAAAMASSPPSAGNSFGASADRWDGVKAFSGIAGFYQKNQELQRLLRNKFQEQTWK